MTNNNRPRLVLCFFFIWASISSFSQSTFTNPLLPSGADPWSIYKDGYYYYTNTLGDRIDVWKTKNIADLRMSERKTIWRPPANMMYSKEIWAPEIHFLNGKWYIYFAADDGKNDHHRIYAIENSGDPMKDEWIFKGKISDGSDKWAIDGSVFFLKEQLYMVWSGWEGDVNGRQDIYIARMADPLTISGKRVRLSTPALDWERHGDLNDPHNPPHVDVNEGPQVLIHGDHIFLIYSASGCWTDYYSLGMLTANLNSDLLDPSAWKKSPAPVFTQSRKNDVFAPGHNSFFKSPNGKEDWILYHANDDPGQGCGKFRSPRAQRFTWKKDGTPDFAVPVKTGQPLVIPN
jgi:GH43 family beta-xylosidase